MIFGAERTIVLAGPLGASEWAMIRAFVGKADRDDLRMRFGQWLDFHSEPILKRFFDIDGKSGELVCTLDDNGNVGNLHRVLISPREAEIGLIVRSDLKRTGIGRHCYAPRWRERASKICKRYARWCLAKTARCCGWRARSAPCRGNPLACRWS